METKTQVFSIFLMDFNQIYIYFSNSAKKLKSRSAQTYHNSGEGCFQAITWQPTDKKNSTNLNWFLNLCSSSQSACFLSLCSSSRSNKDLKWRQCDSKAVINEGSVSTKVGSVSLKVGIYKKKSCSLNQFSDNLACFPEFISA